jgi:hypothetical protein
MPWISRKRLQSLDDRLAAVEREVRYVTDEIALSQLSVCGPNGAVFASPWRSLPLAEVVRKLIEHSGLQLKCEKGTPEAWVLKKRPEVVRMFVSGGGSGGSGGCGGGGSGWSGQARPARKRGRK